MALAIALMVERNSSLRSLLLLGLCIAIAADVVRRIEQFISLSVKPRRSSCLPLNYSDYFLVAVQRPRQVSILSRNRLSFDPVVNSSCSHPRLGRFPCLSTHPATPLILVEIAL